MFATIFTTIASFKMKFFSKNFISLFIVIKIFIFFNIICSHKVSFKIKKYHTFVLMIIVCQKLLKNTKITGITLFPFIFLRNKRCKHNKILINHERIHLKQQLELLIVFFYIWYIFEYFIGLIKFKDRYLAYRNISFEREAYGNEKNLSYLRTRKIWSFWNYLF